LRAQQSNIGGKISSIGAKTVRYTWPADVEGFFEVICLVEGTVLQNLGMNATILTNSNITFIQDLYGGGAAGDSPVGEVASSNGTQVIYIGHFRVRSPTTNVDNQITLTYNSTLETGNVTQWSLDVREITQNNWQSRLNQVPKFINEFTGIEEPAI